MRGSGDFAGKTYRISSAVVEGETGMRADYLQYYRDWLLGVMRTLAPDARVDALTQQCAQLRETDLSDDEIDLLGHLVEGQLSELDPAPIGQQAGHALADHLEVRGAILRGRVRDFYHGAIIVGALRPWDTTQ
jgi:hypothetical protein